MVDFLWPAVQTESTATQSALRLYTRWLRQFTTCGSHKELVSVVFSGTDGKLYKLLHLEQLNMILWNSLLRNIYFVLNVHLKTAESMLSQISILGLGDGPVSTDSWIYWYNLFSPMLVNVSSFEIFAFSWVLMDYDLSCQKMKSSMAEAESLHPVYVKMSDSIK